MNRVALINRIKTRLDEVCATSDMIVEIDMENSKPYDSMIDEVLDESCLEVLLKSPFYSLPIKRDLNVRIVIKDENTGYIVVPDDFLRIVSIRFVGWEKTVVKLNIEGDSTSLMQSNKHIRGGLSKPVCVLSCENDAKVIHYYSVDNNNHTLEEFNYIANLLPEEIEKPNVIDAMCWIACAKVFCILGNASAEDRCYKNAEELLI